MEPARAYDTMSNPLVAPRIPLTLEQEKLASVPQAYFTEHELGLLGRNSEGKAKKRGIKLEDAHSYLGELDMDLHASFYLLDGECLDPALAQNLQTHGKALACAQLGNVAPRRRTHQAMLVSSKVWSKFVPWRGVTRESVESRCKSVVLCQGGTQNTLGRLKTYYPKKGGKFVPVSKSEAREALVRCGIMVPDVSPMSFVSEDGPVMVSVNPDAENGYPYGSKWSNELTHTPILEKACEIRNAIQRAYDEDPVNGVWRWLRAMEASPETLRFVCVKGKCKADPYKKEKVVNRQMRFYNVFPRQVLLNLMRVTQVVDLTAKHATGADTRMKSAIGMTLVRGGAAELVDALEKSVQDDGVGYLHVGDDSWVVIEHEGEYILFSVDCSSFDLTQRGEVTKEVHVVLRDEMSRIHAPSAQLWYAYARERCVTVVNAQTYRWKHGGPSGFPLQSKVNDMLMDVYLRRVIGVLVEQLRSPSPDFSKEVIDSALQRVGSQMGLVARLEDYVRVKAGSLVEALEQVSFLFIGFHFYAEDGKVYVVADFARQLPQLAYPNSFWVDKGKILGMEAVRLAGIYISQGRPPREWQPMFDVWKSAVAELLRRAIASGTDALEWLPESAFVGVSGDDIKSMKGLLNAVERPTDVLWGYEGELEADSYLLGREVQVTGDVKQITRGIVPMKPPTHPVTLRNHGRPPPSVRWTPARPSRRGYQTTFDKVVGFLRQAGEVDYDVASTLSYVTEEISDVFESDGEGSIMDPDYYGYQDFTLRDGTVRRLWGRAADAYEEYGEEYDNLETGSMYSNPYD